MTHDPGGVPEPTRSGRKLRTRGLLVAATGLAVLVSAGCSGAASAGGTYTSQVTIAAVPGIDTAPLWMALNDKGFAANGLSHVVIKRYSTESQELAALQQGQVDIAASDYGDIFYAQAHAAHLRILTDGYDANPGALEVLTRPGSGISSPAGLQGQRVGVPNDQVLTHTASGQPISLETAAANQLLFNDMGSSGIDSINWKPMSQQKELTELAHRQLDAALLSGPYVIAAQSQLGATALLDVASNSMTSLPLTGYVAIDAWVRQHPVAIADFQAAIAQAQSTASMSNQVQQVLPAITGISTTDADLSTVGTYPSSTSVGELQRVVQLLWQSPWTTPAFKGLTAPKVARMLVSPPG